jgi:hypothetical protein
MEGEGELLRTLPSVGRFYLCAREVGEDLSSKAIN